MLFEKLGPNQRLILSALAALEAKCGPKEFLVQEVLDWLWHEKFKLQRAADFVDDPRTNILTRAAHGEKYALQALRIDDATNLRLVVRSRGMKRRSVSRPWARALEHINPSRCFRVLAGAGLIQRDRRGSLCSVKLTELGRTTTTAQ